MRAECDQLLHLRSGPGVGAVRPRMAPSCRGAVQRDAVESGVDFDATRRLDERRAALKIGQQQVVHGRIVCARTFIDMARPRQLALSTRVRRFSSMRTPNRRRVRSQGEKRGSWKTSLPWLAAPGAVDIAPRKPHARTMAACAAV